ncbi:MAG TPA: DUF2062 domain-containing protein [Candidatus Acidoferrum sp.]|jgi:uncharacterized protein (DUF2062 family)
MKDGLLYRRVVRPILDLLRQGVTPEKIAMSAALGVALGTFPVMGLTTAMCAVVALVWRLNLAAIQIVNYLVYPLQIILLLPFYGLGEKLFHAPHLEAITIPKMIEMLRTDQQGTLALLLTATWHAIAVWCVAAPVFAAITYFAMLPALRRVLRKQVAQNAAPM